MLPAGRRPDTVLNYYGIVGTKKHRGCDMRKSARKEIPAASRSRVRSDHALIGTSEAPKSNSGFLFATTIRWLELAGGRESDLRNPVVYRIAVVDGHFVVSGIDEGDGTKLTISNIQWDGAALCFTSVYPRTGRRVKHVFRVFKRGLVKHDVTSTDHEIWRKRPKKRDIKARKGQTARRSGLSTPTTRTPLP